MRRGARTAVGGCLFAVTLAGCGATVVTGQASPAVRASASTSARSSATTGSSAPTVSSAASTSSPVHGPAGLLQFTTPSRNIACYVTSGTAGDPTDPGQARCDIAQATWSPPARPASCTGDWGHALTVGPDGSGFGCVSDSAANDNVADYGTTQVRGAFSCAVDQAGITCTDLDTGHGFAVSREQYRLF